MADCIERALKEFPEADKADIQELYEALSSKRREAFLEGIANPESRFAFKAKRMLEDFQTKLAQQEVMERESIQKRAIEDARVADTAFKDRAEGIIAIMDGTKKPVRGAAGGIDGRKKAIESSMHSQFYLKVNDDATLRIFNEDALEQEVMIETENVANGGKAPVTGSAEAFKLGQAVHHLNRVMQQQLRAAGLFINDIHSYVMRQGHSAEKIKAFGEKEDWVEQMLSSGVLDHEKTFNRDIVIRQDPKEYLGEVWEQITKGTSDLLSESLENISGMSKTAANLAKKAQQARQLYFRDAASFYEYNKKFGSKSLSQQFYASLASVARNAAAVERLGANPMAVIDALKKGVPQGQLEAIDRVVKQMDGSIDRGGEAPSALAYRAFAAISRMSDMGLSTIAQIGDFPVRALNIKLTTGENYFSALQKSITSTFDNFDPARKAENMRMHEVYFDNALGSMYSEHNAIDSPVGATAKSVAVLERGSDLMFKYNGMRKLVSAEKLGHVQALSNQLGEVLHKPFSDLHPDLARTLMGYDIGPLEWEVMKHGVQKTDIDGKSFAATSGLLEIDDEIVREILQRGGVLDKELQLRQISKFKANVRNKLATYYQSATSIAMSEPDLKANALVLKRGGNIDTAGGAIWRAAALYKSYPVAFTTGTLALVRQRMFREKGTSSVINTIVPFIGTALTFGYISHMIKEMIKNKTPPDPFSKETLINSALRSGAMGLYGDFLLADFDGRRGRSVLSAAFGPLGAQIEDIGSLKGELFNKDNPGGKTKAQKVGALATKMVVGNLPLSNVAPLKAGLDYLLFNYIDEALQGHEAIRQRHDKEKKRMKEQGQSHIIGQ